jgi:acyl carrier protein
MPDSSAYQTGYAVGAFLGVFLICGVIGLGAVSIIMAFVRRTTGWIAAAIILSLLGAGGVITGMVFAARGFGKAIAEQSRPKMVVSEDGWVRLEIPGSWSTLRELHDSASLKVGNKFREEYAIVISEKKADIKGTLDDFAQTVTGGIRESLGVGVEVGPIENVTAGKFTAKRCRLAGKIDNIRIVYLHYSVETLEGFHQLIMWTLPSKESRAWPVFERVAETFEVVNPPKSTVLEKRPKPLPHSARKGTVEERLRDIFAEQLGVPAEKVKPEARVKEDLGADDLDRVELIMASEEEFEIEISDDDAEKLTTVREFTQYVSARAKDR